MKKQATQRKRRGLLALVGAAVALAATCAALSPTTALAADPVAHSVDASGASTSYATIDDALAVGYKGQVIVMDTDWFTAPIMTPDNSKLTIDMNGHKIARSIAGRDSVITVGKSAELTLTSSKQADFWYKAFDADDGDNFYTLTTSGGLVTNHDQSDEDIQFCGVYVQDYGTLTLDGVAIAGCYAPYTQDNTDYWGGGVTLTYSTTLNMKNGAVIEHNRARDGGAGVLVEGGASKINMDNSEIRFNYSDKRGGGIYMKAGNCTLTMENGSKIEHNSAAAGGGIYLAGETYTVTSPDGKAYVTENTARASSRASVKYNQSGGGIHAQASVYPDASGTIENITVSNNRSAYDGGGIELDHKNTTVRNCTITGNTAKYEGGGIYVCDNGDVLEDCTITGNSCNGDGSNYEGGGVYVWCDYDIKLSGACTITGNTRGKDSGNADDLFLREGAFAKAYITGSLKAGSSVGVRTGTTGERRIAKNFSAASNKCLFMDLSYYHVSYGTDEGGDAWQRNGMASHTVQVNGSDVAVYKPGSTVAVSAPGGGAGRVFWFWSEPRTQGLPSASTYINEKTKYSSTLTFTMPSNDVNLTAVYADTVDSAVIYGFKAPVGGEDLPATASLTRADGKSSGANNKIPATITWYEVGENGKRTAAAGKAKAGATYVAVFSVPRSVTSGCFFSEGLGAAGVTVRADSAAGAKAASAKVDATTGTLTAESGEFKAADGEKGDAAATTGSVTVSCKKQGLLADGASAAAALADDGDAATDPDLLGKVEVTYAYDEKTEKVTIAAPAREGYNFCNWEGVEAGWVSDDVDGVVVIPVGDLAKIDELVAYYTPVVTDLVIGLDAPAAGADLPGGCAKLTATCSDGTFVDFVEETGNEDGFTVTWSPDDGTAVYSTAYTALIELADAPSLVGVEDVLAAGATVTCSNGVKATSAGFVLVDGKLCLAVTFPVTADKATDPDDSDSGKTDEDEKPGDTTDDDKTDESGKTDGSETTGGTEGNEAQVNGQAASTVTTTVTTSKAAKKGTPSTGDVTFTAAGALLVTSAIFLAAATISRRNQH